MMETLIILTNLVTAGATCGLVAVAAIQLRALRRSAEEARRPYLFAQVRKDKTREGKAGIYLSITDYGQRGAARIIPAVSADPREGGRKPTVCFRKSAWHCLSSAWRHLVLFPGASDRRPPSKFHFPTGSID